jgi:hypothetical protein
MFTSFSGSFKAGRRAVSSSLTNGLTLRLDAADSSSYGGSGSTWTDTAGTADNITLVGSPTFRASVPSHFAFNGSSQYGTGSATNIVPSTAYTKSVWFKIAAYTDNNIVSGSGHFMYMGNNPSVNKKIYCGHADWINYENYGSTGTINLNTWYHATLTFSTTNGMNLYINGVLDSTYTAQKTAHPGTGTVNLATYAGGNLLNGSIAKVYCYNRELSAAEVLQLHNDTKSEFTATQVLYFDPSISASYSGSGTTINDLSGNGRNGTMSNITFTSPYFSYNGTSSQIAIADHSTLEPGSGSWTMEAWVNQNASGNDVVLGKFDPGGLSSDVSYSIRTTVSTYFAQIGSGSGSGGGPTGTLYVNSSNHVGSLNTWYQLVYVFKNGATKTLQTFVNGVSVGTVNHNLAGILNTTANLYIGSYNNGEYAQWFDGKIGITRLYNDALTSDQVLRNYNADKSKYGL